MNVHTLVVTDFMTNCFLVWKDSAALVIDPGGEASRILAALEERNLSVAAYLLTHGHADHVAALADMVDACPAPVALHALDLEWAFENPNRVIPLLPAPRAAKVSRVMAGGESFEDAGIACRVLHTPGHTPGSVCFYVESEQAMFTGDTLFAGSVGRTDFRGGDSRTLQESLRLLADFPDDTRLYTGHGPITTMGQEKLTNPFM